MSFPEGILVLLLEKEGVGAGFPELVSHTPVILKSFYLLDTPAEKTAYLRSSWVWIFYKGELYQHRFYI